MKKTPLILLTAIILSAYSNVAYGDIEYGSEPHGLREDDWRDAVVYYTITPQDISKAYENSKYDGRFGDAVMYGKLTIHNDTVTLSKKVKTIYLETQFFYEYKFFYPDIRNLYFSDYQESVYELKSDQYLIINRSPLSGGGLNTICNERDRTITAIQYKLELFAERKSSKIYEKTIHNDTNRVSFAFEDNAGYQFYFLNIDLDRLNEIEEMLKTFRYKHYFISPIEAPAVDYAPTDILQRFEKFKPKLLEYKQNQKNNEI